MPRGELGEGMIAPSAASPVDLEAPVLAAPVDACLGPDGFRWRRRRTRRLRPADPARAPAPARAVADLHRRRGHSPVLGGLRAVRPVLRTVQPRRGEPPPVQPRALGRALVRYRLERARRALACHRGLARHPHRRPARDAPRHHGRDRHRSRPGLFRGHRRQRRRPARRGRARPSGGDPGLPVRGGPRPLDEHARSSSSGSCSP